MVTNGHQEMIIMLVDHIKYKQEEGKKKYIVTKEVKTRSSWLNCALRDDEAVYWVSIGHYEAVAVGN